MSAFIISLPALERNALILRDVADAAGCRIALALKGFSCWPCFEALSPCAGPAAPPTGRKRSSRPARGTGPQNRASRKTPSAP